MEKGMIPVIKSVTMMLSIIFVIYLLYVFAFKSSILLSSPCWADVIKGLKNIESQSRKTPELILDGKCVKKVVFTSDPYICELTCNEHFDQDDASDCAKKCRSNKDKGTFIVALPKDIKGKLGKAWASRNVMWLFPGKPGFFTVNCGLLDVDPSINECIKERMDKWTCDISQHPEGFKRIYSIFAFTSDEGKTCEIAEIIGPRSGDASS